MTKKLAPEAISDDELDGVIGGAAADGSLGQSSAHTTGGDDAANPEASGPTGLTENVTLNFRNFNTSQ